MTDEHRHRTEDLAHIRGTVLGEVRAGEMRIEEKHPVLKKMVRISIFSNLACIVMLMGVFRILDLLPPHDEPFLPALSWYFFFGMVYGIFAQTLYVLGRQAEHAAIKNATTQNRRYEWHTRYDTKNMTEEDLKKIANDPAAEQKQPGRHEQSTAVGVGSKSYFYSGIFALLALGTCTHGIYTFFVNLLIGS